LTVVALAGCAEPGSTDPLGDGGDSPDGSFAGCNLDLTFLRDGGVGRDGIPALTDPKFVSAAPQAENAYLGADDRVVGVVIDGEPLAIPHNTLWWHEIVNLNRGATQLAVSYCPLTGSSLVFDRSAVDGDEFGVSGLLWQNNLIMYNRRSGESLWPQMLGEARCGPQTGTVLPRYPAIEISWEGWKQLHPDTKVISSSEDPGGNWTFYPYGDYESLSNNEFLFPRAMPCPYNQVRPLSSPGGVLRDTPLCPDTRRPAKERVLGLPATGQAGIAFPFGLLTEAGDLAAVHAEVEGERMVVFWNSEYRGAAAFRASAGGQELNFVVRDGVFMDEETGTVWNMRGEGSVGALSGTRLEPVAEAFVAFWGAWTAFRPFTDLWAGGGG
jgi:hypothetical protein